MAALLPLVVGVNSIAAGDIDGDGRLEIFTDHNIMEGTQGFLFGVDADGKERRLRRGSVLRQGDTVRTARGRVATKNAFLHLGLKPPTRQEAAELPLFDDD